MNSIKVLLLKSVTVQGAVARAWAPVVDVIIVAISIQYNTHGDNNLRCKGVGCQMSSTSKLAGIWKLSQIHGKTIDFILGSLVESYLCICRETTKTVDF